MDRRTFENLYIGLPIPPIKLEIIDGRCSAEKSGTVGHKFEQNNQYFMRCRKCGGIYMFGDEING